MNDLLELSVVVPVHNERDNVVTLIEEIEAALSAVPDFRFEMVFVDDASRDDTFAVLQSAQRRFPRLRVLQHAQQSGQSTAVRNGVKHARGAWIATLDGDGQNDPADIRKLLAERDSDTLRSKRCFAGWRRDRRDTWLRRISSRIANAVRGYLLKDQTPDSGCGLKLFERSAFIELPYFDHMHRFLPALFARHGVATCSVVVSHRPRTQGISKYGVWNRLWVGIVDIVGVAWLQRRVRNTELREQSQRVDPLSQRRQACKPHGV